MPTRIGSGSRSTSSLVPLILPGTSVWRLVSEYRWSLLEISRSNAVPFFFHRPSFTLSQVCQRWLTTSGFRPASFRSWHVSVRVCHFLWETPALTWGSCSLGTGSSKTKVQQHLHRHIVKRYFSILVKFGLFLTSKKIFWSLKAKKKMFFFELSMNNYCW